MRRTLRDMHSEDPFLPTIQFHIVLIDNLHDAIEKIVKNDFKDLREGKN